MKSSRKPPRPYSRHGLNALKARVMVRGLQAIDGRSAPARALLAWRKELVGDLGGEEAISAQERAVVGLAVQTKLLLDSIDAWLLAQPRTTYPGKNLGLKGSRWCSWFFLVRGGLLAAS